MLFFTQSKDPDDKTKLTTERKEVERVFMALRKRAAQGRLPGFAQMYRKPLAHLLDEAEGNQPL